MERDSFIPITSDYGFKATFGNENDTLFLRTALQALIKSNVPIREVMFDKNAFEGLTAVSRSGIFDLACTDENGSHFIVEMQVGYAPNFVQPVRRCGMKFYALHKFNTLVEKGGFKYANLPKIYVIAFLEKSILPTPAYHTVANLRDETGEIIDAQMTFITVELAKFDLAVANIRTNLEKLIYTMKTVDTSIFAEYPDFWDEEWLRRAINELNTRGMTSEERYQFARITAKNAEAIWAEKQKIEDAKEAVKTETVKTALKMGLSVEQAAQLADVSVEFVQTINQQ